MPPAARRVKWWRVGRVACKTPWDTLRGVPRSEQRYSRSPIHAVECAGGLRAQGPRNHHAARLDRYRLRTRLYRPLVRGCELRGPDSAVRARRRLAPLHLSALARDLLHLLDVLWLGGARIAHRLRLSDHLCRAHPVGWVVLPADHTHRAAGQGTEHHVDC